jgi:hypothetical protein
VLKTTVEPEACDIEAASVALKMYKTMIPDLRNTALGYHFQHRNSRTFPIESLAHDSGCTLVCAEYGYPKGSPNTNSWRRNPPLQLSIQRSPQHTSKWPNSKPQRAIRQQAIAKTPAKWSAYQIPSVIVVFVILVFKV